MFTKNRSRLVIAIGLALLVGFTASTTTLAKPNQPVAIIMQEFRSQSRYDGSVTEYADDYWMGGIVNSGSPAIYIGDDAARRNVVGILDFDTSLLPDTVIVDDAYIEVTVLQYNARFGDPYTLLGDINVDFESPYFGASRELEAQDWQWFGSNFAGYLPWAYKSNQKLFFQIDPLVVGALSTTDPTQFKLYFWDDNEDSLPQGITIASGNHSKVSFRPKLIVYYYYP
jgi:hypothetical protein